VLNSPNKSKPLLQEEEEEEEQQQQEEEEEEGEEEEQEGEEEQEEQEQEGIMPLNLQINRQSRNFLECRPMLQRRCWP
jgi:hypothetical protein